ncbi:MAG: PAS domain-containing sensor histidine kinase [Cyclobacteriaceae bacterium]
MPEKKFNNLLLTFKKYGDRTIEIIYLSQAFLEIIKDPSNRLDSQPIEKLFPTEGKNLFPQLVESILEKRELVLPLFIFESTFIWVKTEGHSIPLGNQGLLLNILLVPVHLSEASASWIKVSDSESIFSHTSNPISQQYSSLSVLKDYLQNRSQLEPNIRMEHYHQDLPDLRLPLKNNDFVSTNLKNGYTLMELFGETSAPRFSNYSAGENNLPATFEPTFTNHLFYRLNEISQLYKGKKIFDESLKFLSLKFGFKLSFIGDYDVKTSESNILSLFHEGKIKNKLISKWEKLVHIDQEIPTGKGNHFLIRNHTPAEKILPDIYKELNIRSSLYMDLFDQKNEKVGFMCFFTNIPIENTLPFKDLFNQVGNCLGKELYLFKCECALQETNFMHDAILNGTAYSIFAVNQDNQIVLINDNTLPVFNLKNNDNLMATRLVNGEKTCNLSEIVKDFSESGQYTDYFLLKTDEDNFKELKISFTKVRSKNKNQVAYLFFVDDITDRTLSEKKLIASEQLFRSIAENFPKGSINVLDKSFNYIYSDGEEYRQSGLDPNNFIGKSHLDNYTGENYKITKRYLEKLLLGETVNYEISFRNEKYLKSAVPLTNNAGEIDRILLVKQNITEAKKLEAEREKLIKDLKSHNEELLRFAYIVSHNLRAPIVNISLLLDLFNEKEPNDPENIEVIENLKISTNLLDATLQDLIEVVSIKKQKIPKVDLIDFKLLLNNVEKSLYNQLKESGIIIHKDFSGLEEMNYVYAHMENFFMNFMTNAVKYKHPDRIPEVWITTHRENDYCVIEFEDNGIGLDLKRYGDRLFGLYQRFHNHVEGKGLGLYLVREQIRVNDGRIEVDSQVGRGTLFKVYLRHLILNNHTINP